MTTETTYENSWDAMLAESGSVKITKAKNDGTYAIRGLTADQLRVIESALAYRGWIARVASGELYSDGTGAKASTIASTIKFEGSFMASHYRAETAFSEKVARRINDTLYRRFA